MVELQQHHRETGKAHTLCAQHDHHTDCFEEDFIIKYHPLIAITTSQFFPQPSVFPEQTATDHVQPPQILSHLIPQVTH